MTLGSLLLHPVTHGQLEKTVSDLPHALILHGTPGIGSDLVAAALAQQAGSTLATLYPKKRQPNGSYVVDPKQGTVIIDDVRDLYERTRGKLLHPHIVILNLGSRPMLTGAQNAFLKLLEEPQANIHFILAVDDISLLLPTILSRCQKVEVLPVTEAQTTSLLDTLKVSDPTKRARITYIASGLPALIHQLATDDAFYESRVQSVQDARTLLESDGYTRLKIIYSYKDRRADTLQLIDDTIHQLKLSLKKSPSSTTIEQLNRLIDAYTRIQANGSVQLNLARVLL